MFTGFICAVIPFVVMFISSLLVTHHMFKQKQRLKQKNFKKEKRFALVMISMNLFSFSTEFPYSVLTITYDSLGLSYYGTNGYNCVNTISNCLPNFDFFVLYFSNKLFRKEIDRLVTVAFNYKSSPQTKVVKSNVPLNPTHSTGLKISANCIQKQTDQIENNGNQTK